MKAMVSDEDYPLVSQHQWYPRYSKTGELSNLYSYSLNRMLHMYIVDNIPVKELPIDDQFKMQYATHIIVTWANKNVLDNTRENLKIIPVSKYYQRAKKKSSNYKGVSYNKRFNKWSAISGSRYAGFYDTEIEAAMAADIKTIELYGDISILNFPEKIKEYKEHILQHQKPGLNTHGSQYKGVEQSCKRYKGRTQWAAMCQGYVIGYYDTEKDAATAYDIEIIKTYLDKTRDDQLNFPEDKQMLLTILSTKRLTEHKQTTQFQTTRYPRR